MGKFETLPGQGANGCCAAECQRKLRLLGGPRADPQVLSFEEVGVEQLNTYLVVDFSGSGRLTTVAEVAVRLLDHLPLHSHFGPLPGDEKVGVESPEQR